MLNFPITIVSVLEVVLLLVPALVSVAFVTLAERKTMASMQRRLGPNSVGYLGQKKLDLYEVPWTTLSHHQWRPRYKRFCRYYSNDKNAIDALY